MSSNHSKSLDKNKFIAQTLACLRHLLRDIIDLDHGLLSMIISKDILTREQIGLIKTQLTNEDQIDQLLDFVIDLPYQQQKQFLLALYKSQQTHVNNFIVSNGHRPTSHGPTGNWPLFLSDERELILRQWTKMSELIDPVNGLLEELLSVGCINVQHRQRIEAGETNTKKNEILLGVLLMRSVSDYNKFLRCLVKTKQNQVAFLLKSDVPEGSRPLSKSTNKKLLSNYAVLTSLIDTTNGLLAELLAVDCITWRQKEFIECTALKSQRNS